MDEARVDAALLVTPGLYGWANGYALEAAARHPTRFRVVGRIDHRAPDVEERVEEFAADPHAVGIRLVVRDEETADDLRSGRFDRLLRAAEQHDLVICMFAVGHEPAVHALVESHPGLRFVIDHLGLSIRRQPTPEAFEHLGRALEYARHPNVTMKLSGAPCLSIEPYPYADLWPRLHRYVEAFGTERLMWGSDWTRVPNATFDEGVRYFRDTDELAAQDKEQMMGRTLRWVFHWPAP